MLKNFKTKSIQNSYVIFGGVDTSDDFVIEDFVDGAITDSDNDNFVVEDLVDGL